MSDWSSTELTGYATAAQAVLTALALLLAGVVAFLQFRILRGQGRIAADLHRLERERDDRLRTPIVVPVAVEWEEIKLQDAARAAQQLGWPESAFTLRRRVLRIANIGQGAALQVQLRIWVRAMVGEPWTEAESASASLIRDGGDLLVSLEFVDGTLAHPDSLHVSNVRLGGACLGPDGRRHVIAYEVVPPIDAPTDVQ